MKPIRVFSRTRGKMKDNPYWDYIKIYNAMSVWMNSIHFVRHAILGRYDEVS